MHHLRTSSTIEEVVAQWVEKIDLFEFVWEVSYGNVINWLLPQEESFQESVFSRDIWNTYFSAKQKHALSTLSLICLGAIILVETDKYQNFLAPTEALIAIQT